MEILPPKKQTEKPNISLETILKKFEKFKLPEFEIDLSLMQYAEKNKEKELLTAIMENELSSILTVPNPAPDSTHENRPAHIPHPALTNDPAQAKSTTIIAQSFTENLPNDLLERIKKGKIQKIKFTQTSPDTLECAINDVPEFNFPLKSKMLREYEKKKTNLIQDLKNSRKTQQG